MKVKPELLEDIQDYDTINAAIEEGREELIPSEQVEALLHGENPIKVWREYRGYTQQRLAEQVKISVPFLSQLETGKRNPSVSVLTSIAGVLGVDVGDLLPKTSE